MKYLIIVFCFLQVFSKVDTTKYDTLRKLKKNTSKIQVQQMQLNAMLDSLFVQQKIDTTKFKRFPKKAGKK